MNVSWHENTSEIEERVRAETVAKILTAVKGIQGWIIDSDSGQHVKTDDPNNCVDRTEVIDAIMDAVI